MTSFLVQSQGNGSSDILVQPQGKGSSDIIFGTASI